MPAAATHRAPHPPLAHDARGIPIVVPDGIAGWRVKRHTAGRPRNVLGPDRQPLRLPVAATPEDLLDLCGAGTFRLDAIDDQGHPLDFVTTTTVGGDEEDRDRADPLPAVAAPRAGGSDLRYALEVTAHMARAQSDALRAVANAQADWIKGLATAKAIPRNGVWHLPPPQPANDTTSADEDDDTEEDDEEANMTALGHIASIANNIGPIVNKMMGGAPPPPASEPRNAAAPVVPAVTPTPDVATPSIQVAMVLAQATPRTRALACRLLARGDDTARAVANAIHALPVAAAVTHLEQLTRDLDARRAARNGRGPAPPPPPPPAAIDPAAHLTAVMAQLSPAEIGRAQALLASFDPARVDALKADLLRLSPEDAAAFVRRALQEAADSREGGHTST